MRIKPFRKKKIVLATGGFDPLHKGHIKYLKEAALLGDMLIVGIHSNERLTRRRGRPFLDIEDRHAIIAELGFVNKTVCFTSDMDADDTALKFIQQIMLEYPKADIICANGYSKPPEDNKPLIDNPQVTFVFDVGREVVNSSFEILDEWRSAKTLQEWGWYRILAEGVDPKTGLHYKLRELMILPKKSLMNQRHKDRSELWTQIQGQTQLNLHRGLDKKILTPQDPPQVIPAKSWYEASNPFKIASHIVELQYGKQCIDDDVDIALPLRKKK